MVVDSNIFPDPVFLHRAELPEVFRQVVSRSRCLCSQMIGKMNFDGMRTIMMSFLKFKFPLAILIVSTAAYVVFMEVQASEDSDEQVSESAMWEPTRDELAQIDHTCNANVPGYAQCFTKQMSELGAPDEAVSFSKQFAEHNNGVVAVLQDFHPVDSVDLGYVYFPAASEAKHGWLLLNGVPSIINVDNPDLLPENQMEKDPQFIALRQNHANARLLLDDTERAPGASPQMSTLSNSNQRFLIPYSIKDGCRTCAVLGHAYYSFDFDPTGQLMGVKYVKFAANTAQAAGK
jgi:kynurenine formamidase